MKPITQGQFKIQAALKHSYNVKYSREGKWLIAEIPELNLATHAETPEELQANLEDLVKDYMEDPDTPKPVNKIQITFSRTSNPRRVLGGAQTKT